MDGYSKFMVDLYDQLFPRDEEEYDFYRHFLSDFPGPALEIGCGTGQLLLPYCKEGFDVMGLDSSPQMLDLCNQKAYQEKMNVSLVCQLMQFISIEKKFGTIYAPSCSFMHVTNVDEAQQTLDKFYEHLILNGQVLISVFRGWQNAQEDLGVLYHNELPVHCMRKFTYDPTSQIAKGEYYFDFQGADGNQSKEMCTLVWRCYSPEQVCEMLTKAGFSSLEMYADYSLSSKNKDTDIVVIRAIKVS